MGRNKYFQNDYQESSNNLTADYEYIKIKPTEIKEDKYEYLNSIHSPIENTPTKKFQPEIKIERFLLTENVEEEEIKSNESFKSSSNDNNNSIIGLS